MFKDSDGLLWYADENGLARWGVRYYKSTDCTGTAYIQTVFTNMAINDGVTVLKTIGPPETFIAQSANSPLLACETPPPYILTLLPTTVVGPFGPDVQPPYEIR